MARTPRALPLLLLLGLPLPEPTPTLGYNIDTTHPRMLAPDAGGNFGYQVLESKDASLLVGAPGDQNSTGQLYQCVVKNSSCQPIPLPVSAQMPHLGMVLESDSEDDRVITCGPGLKRTCDGNLYVSGACYLFTGRLERPQEITAGYAECLKGDVDLVFLFDGSGSMTNEQFKAILDFMIDVMEKLGNSTIHFAAVQFSVDVRTEFDFNAYKQNPNPRMLLRNVMHMKNLTFTFKAIQTVAEEVFTPDRGAREDATRVMIMITDGDPSDTGNVEAAEKKNIVRYIIGIGNNFGADKFGILKQFASEPVSQFVKVLDSFDKLKSLFSELQAKIYNIEGTSSRSSFHLELSSSGFSVDMSKGRLVLGAVGADDWAGGLIELQGDLVQETFIKSPSSNEKIKDAYLGYAVKSMQHQNRTLYAVGAPRYRHIGMVVVFQTHPDSTNWTDIQHIEGEQIGSYFGAVLCSVDMDGDGDTDMLLVGSPLYYEERSGGRVHIYHWDQARLTNTTVLQGAMGNPLGRFGAAITELADLNGDGWADIAVGAPLENEERGAVYIYNGHPTGLNTEYSQRIEGETVSPGMKYFGQSIHGQMDLDGDGLTDVAVGALGKVFVLSSRPILTVMPTVHFLPEEIPVKQVECSGTAASQQGVQVTLTICFNTSRATTHYREPFSANLTYWLEVDANRMKSRGEFGNGQRNMSGSRSISDGEHCINERIQIGSCIQDYVTPINILLRFALEEDNITSWLPMLDPLYNSSVTEIPFKKNCGEDEKCEADLKISFHNSTSQTLLVSPSEALKVVLELLNEGEDAYHATVHMPLPPGLAFRKASVLQHNGQARISCNGLAAPNTNFRNLTCKISHPIYWVNSMVRFELLFDVLSNSSWEDFLELQVVASSDNERDGSLENNRARWQIPVLYRVNIITKRLENSTQYVNFSSLHTESKTVQHLYQVENLLPGSFPKLDVKVFVMVPEAFLKELVWLPQGVQSDSNVICQVVRKDAHSFCFNRTKSCLSGHKQIYECHLGELDTPSVITVSGLLQDNNEIQDSSRSQFCTALCFTFNTSKYSLLSNDFVETQVTTEVELIYVMNYLPVYVGSSIGGLLLFILIIVGLYKCGFFKRNYKERMDHGNGVGPAGASPEADTKVDGEFKEALTTDAPSE